MWIADRDASRVVGLDGDLLVARTFAVERPLAVAAAAESALWVLRSAGDSSSAPHRLVRLDRDGRITADLPFERARDLDALAGGARALVVERRADATARLVRVDVDARATTLVEREGLACVVGEDRSALVGADDGAVLRVDAASGDVLASARVDGRVVDLAAGPLDGEAWVLVRDRADRVLFLDAHLATRWSTELSRAAASLAPVPGEERAWIVCADEPCVVRVGPLGATELERCGLPLPGLERALAWREGAIVTAVGAILRVDRDGALRPGQGGFDHVAGLAATRR